MSVRWIAGHLEEVLGAALLAGMAFLALANVITRYIFHYPLAFTEELEINALVWLTLFGTSLAFRRGHHLRMLFFQDKLPPKFRFWLTQLLQLAGIGLFATLGYLGVFAASRRICFGNYLRISQSSPMDLYALYSRWLHHDCSPYY